MPEHFRVVCTINALYKCSDLPFLPLIEMLVRLSLKHLSVVFLADVTF